eukprot:scaffold22596_cov65-Cyclotella_meneghiniana.AAC.6
MPILIPSSFVMSNIMNHVVFRSLLDDVVSLESIIVGDLKCDDDVANTIQLSSKEENSKPSLF